MWNIFKNIFLGLFGFAIIAIGLTITSHFDEGLKNDNFTISYIEITWVFYIICKAYSEYNSLKDGK